VLATPWEKLGKREERGVHSPSQSLVGRVAGVARTLDLNMDRIACAEGCVMSSDEKKVRIRRERAQEQLG
jgi:hypothetical protein